METQRKEDTGAEFWALSAFHWNAKTAPIEREYFNQTDFAKLLGVSVMTIWRFEHGYITKTGKHVPPVEGFPRSVNLGGRRLWKRADIDLFMAGLRHAA